MIATEWTKNRFIVVTQKSYVKDLFFNRGDRPLFHQSFVQIRNIKPNEN
jgi:hypothetical protein